MNSRFAIAVAAVSGVGLGAIVLLGLGSDSGSVVATVAGIALLCLAAVGLALLGRAVVVAERRQR